MKNSKESTANSRDISSVVSMHSPLHRIDEVLTILSQTAARTFKEWENKEEVEDDNS